MKSFKYKGVTYKVGDKVLLTNKFPHTWVSDMGIYLGKVVTISKIKYDSGYAEFEIDEDKSDDDYKWLFYPENIVKKISGTFFKTLPNDFTGTIDVVNGYIGKPEILDEEEKRYLEGVIRPFRNKVDHVAKHGICNKEYIFIDLEDDILQLPYFSTNTMYKGMEIDEGYTLKELGLFEEE